MHFVRFKSSTIRKQAAKIELKNVDITQTVKLQIGFCLAQRSFMYVFYSFRECHYLKRTKIEIKLKIRIVRLVCCSKP